LIIFKYVLFFCIPMHEQIGHSRISYRGQLVLPKKVKEKLNAHEGNYVLFYDEGNKITITLGALKPIE